MQNFGSEYAHTAVGKMPSGLYIVTTGDIQSGTGYLASLVQQVSLNPMVVAVAVGADRPAVEIMRQSGCFALHVIAKEDSAMVKHFGKGFEKGQAAFQGLEVEGGILKTPILTRTLAAVECEILPGQAQPGDHLIFFGKAIAGGVFHKEQQPKVHTRTDGRRY